MTAPRIPLRRLFKIVNGGTPTADDINWGGNVPWATPADFGETLATLRRPRRYLTAEGARSGSTIVPEGSLLLSTRAPIGYVALTGSSMAFNQGCRALVPSGDAEPRFFGYQLEAMRPSLQALGLGSTFTELSSEALMSFLVAAPDLEQQHRIADFLDAEAARIERLTEVLSRTAATLAERREAGVLEAVSGVHHTSRQPSALSWLTTVPAAWQEVRLGLVAHMGSGHTPSRSHPEWWEECTIPWITTGEVQQVRGDRQEVVRETRELISEVGLVNSAAELHPAGTVVLSRTASAGFSAVMGSDMATSQDFVTWTCGPRLDPYYLLWCLRAMRPHLLGRLATGSTHKTIYFPDLQMLRIPLPGLAEQREIVSEIRTQNAQIDQLADKVGRQRALLAERRASLIAAAVTGELDVSTASGRSVAG